MVGRGKGVLFLRREDPLKSTAPTDQLKAEHEKILILLGILKRICAKLEAKRDINPLYLGQVIEFMKIFVDKFHHGKEEDLLFPVMRKAGVRRGPGPIGELMIDHIKGRSPRPSTSTLAADRITERGSITRGKTG